VIETGGFQKVSGQIKDYEAKSFSQRVLVVDRRIRAERPGKKGGVMMNYQPTLNSMERYDDGVALDYAFMIRMWGAFSRSLTAFDRKCGLPVIDRERINVPKKQAKELKG